jgi:hypothetical protein
VIEILQSIRQADMSPLLSRIYKSDGGSEALDTLMKYMYVLRSQLIGLGSSLNDFTATKAWLNLQDPLSKPSRHKQPDLHKYKGDR